jgi:hypothetical protein
LVETKPAPTLEEVEELIRSVNEKLERANFTLAELLRKADELLERAKHAGK